MWRRPYYPTIEDRKCNRIATSNDRRGCFVRRSTQADRESQWIVALIRAWKGDIRGNDNGFQPQPLCSPALSSFSAVGSNAAL